MESENTITQSDEVAAETETETPAKTEKKKSPTKKKSASKRKNDLQVENSEEDITGETLKKESEDTIEEGINESLREKKPDKKKTSSKKEKKPADDEAVIDAPSIDSLLYDGDDGVITSDGESGAGFEEFLADYKEKIERTLSMARDVFRKKDAESEAYTEEPEKAPDTVDEKEKTELTDTDHITVAPISSADTSEAPQFTMDIIDPSRSDEDSESAAYNPEKPRFIDTVFDFAELFIFTLAAVLVITGFFFKHTVVEGGSMMNTLQNGEHLIISDFLYTPERGDIVVFADYSAGQKTPYVKRVIGIAGDKVLVDSAGNVTVNGKMLEEEYVFIDGHFPAGYGKEYTVKEGEVFVLGDHRNASYDSALFYDTAVDEDSILGKVLLRIYPFEKIGWIE